MQSPSDQAHITESVSAILDALPTALVLAAPDGSIKFLNDPAARLFGYERQELIGRTVEVLIPADRRQRHRERREAYSASPRNRVMGTGLLYPAVRKDGSEFPAEVGLSPITIAGVSHVLATVIDVSERKRAEDLERLAEVGQLAMGMAREIATPLRAIVDSSERMMRTELQGSIRQQTRQISEQARRANRTVQNVLAYAQAQELHQADLDLGDLLQKVIDRYIYTGPTSRSTTTFIDLTLSPGLPPIQGDKAQLETVFENVIENARQAGVPRNGSVRITISVSEENDNVSISVADDGPGLPVGQEEQIFRPFFTTGRTSGSPGLGLSVSKAIIEQHGGQMWADRRAENGATFHITLPLPGQATRQDHPNDRLIADSTAENDSDRSPSSIPLANGPDIRDQEANLVGVEVPQVVQDASVEEAATLIGPVILLILPPVDEAAVLQVLAWLQSSGKVRVEESQTTEVGSVRLGLNVVDPIPISVLRNMPLVLDIHEEVQSRQLPVTPMHTNVNDQPPRTFWLLLRSS